MALPEPNNAQAGLVSVVVGAGAAWFGLYVNSTSSKHVNVPQQQGSISASKPAPAPAKAKKEEPAELGGGFVDDF
tara:strand:+ start:2825 stop:3049 length:225 start_codon:yes stop_codon:yes gene_type:complete